MTAQPEQSIGDLLRESRRDAIAVPSRGGAFFGVTRFEEVYRISARPRSVIAVEWRGPGNDWCVIDSSGFVYSKTGRPRLEPMPSSRTDAFKRRYRFGLTDALVIASTVAHRRDQEWARQAELDEEATDA